MSANPKEPDSEVAVPADLKAVLKSAPDVAAAWEKLTAIGRRDFVAWINEAKQPETRARRIERCRENLLLGKRRPCCFAVVPMDFYKALGDHPKAKTVWSGLTAQEKRDVTDWIQDTDDKEVRKARVAEACDELTAGNKYPAG